MASATVSPVSASSTSIERFTSALLALRAIKPTLELREKESNVLLPMLLKLAQAERATSSTTPPNNLWIVIRSVQSASSRSSVDFILSCTEGPMGEYPVFIWSARPVQALSRQFIALCMRGLAQSLQESVKTTRRVFSIFAPTPIARAFASEWSMLTGHEIDSSPYYHATFSSITSSTLIRDPSPTVPRASLRKAVPADAKGVANLCWEFAATSEPFVLDRDGALREARLLIAQDQAYVCELQGHIACLVAVTRSSPHCAAITKVVTHPDFLRRGLARALVAEVCARLLVEKDEVVLYVGIGNTAAEKTYRAVGFSNLSPSQATEPSSSTSLDMDTEWLELGFEDTDIGHW